MFKDEIIILTIASIVISVILVILLFYLMIRKTIENNQSRKIKIIKDTMNPKLLDFLVEGNVVRGLQPDTTLKKIALEELLLRYSETIEGEEEKQNIQKLAELHLKNYYRKGLNSLIWSKRMNALFHIEDLRVKSLTNDVIKALQTTRITNEELILAFRILASFEYFDIFALLQSKWDRLTEYDFRSILSRLTDPMFESFILQFHHCPNGLKFAILEVISIKRDSNYSNFLESTFSKGEGEIRLRALKAISSIGYCSNVKLFLPLVDSSVWQERMLTAKILGNLRENEHISLLKKLLSDRVWYVRYQAGQSIMMFPNGKEILREICETSEDPFSKDMASEWIYKGEI